MFIVTDLVSLKGILCRSIISDEPVLLYSLIFARAFTAWTYKVET